jgi:hypothetical protein
MCIFNPLPRPHPAPLLCDARSTVLQNIRCSHLACPKPVKLLYTNIFSTIETMSVWDKRAKWLVIWPNLKSCPRGRVSRKVITFGYIDIQLKQVNFFLHFWGKNTKKLSFCLNVLTHKTFQLNSLSHIRTQSSAVVFSA